MMIDNVNNLNNSRFCGSSIKKSQVYAITIAAIAPAVEGAQNFFESLKTKKNFSYSNVHFKRLLSMNGIALVRIRDNLMNIRDDEGNFYALEYPICLDTSDTNTFLVNELSVDSKDALKFGLKNYIDFTKQYKRQNMIHRGLNIHSYNLQLVSNDLKQKQAEHFSKGLKQKIIAKNLFFIEDEAFYYDDTARTVYSINNSEVRLKKPHIKSCRFITNQDGIAIGYEKTYFDMYSGRTKQEKFIEQQSPSEELPCPVNRRDENLFAEAFRFGNKSVPDKYILKLSDILLDLSINQHIKNPKTNNIKFVSFVQGDNKIFRFSYYDSRSGQSYIYNTDGEFIYKILYDYNIDGKIEGCHKSYNLDD